MPDTKLTFYGHALFLIESSKGLKIGIDPYNEKVKDNLPQISADIAISSHDHFDHANVALFDGNPQVINTPGIKKIMEMNIEGLISYHDESRGKLRGKNIIFIIEVDGIKFTHLGDLGHMPDKEQISRLEGTDILMVPVGGIYTINSVAALEVIKKIKPKVAIPMHYKLNDTKIDVDPLEPFTNRAGSFKKMSHTISINKDRLPEKTEIWVLDSK